MVDGSILDKISDKIKKITGIEKFNNTKILIDADDKLPDSTMKMESMAIFSKNCSSFFIL